MPDHMVIVIASAVHRLYTAFDELLDTFGVYKVETIGGEQE